MDKTEALKDCLDANRHYDRLIDAGVSVELLDKALLNAFECGESFTVRRMLEMSDSDLATIRRNRAISQLPSQFVDYRDLSLPLWSLANENANGNT